MKDDRLRISVDATYLTALGRAAYCFAYMEWAAVYCGEKLNSGYVGTVAIKTAGEIARDIAGSVSLIPDTSKQARCRTAVNEFRRLVDRRNDLVHANPATVGSEQRLVRHGAPWQPTEIDDLADDFAACAIELNDLHHHVP